MPNQFLGKGDDNDSLEWLHIDDFTSGIYDYDYASAEFGDISTVPAPLGSAYGPLTVGCIGLPSGGLSPLPWLKNPPVNDGGHRPAFITGVEANTARISHYLTSSVAQDLEMLLMIEYEDGSNHVFQMISYEVTAEVPTTVLNSVSALTGSFWGSPYPYWTLMSPAGNPALMQPVLVFPSIVPTDADGTNGHMYVYPSPTSPASYGTEDIANAATLPTGQLVVYDGRVMGLAVILHGWPPGSPVFFTANEFIYYTDPPGVDTYGGAGGSALATLVPENPFGYGASGSISAGELFLVKRRGGGVLVYGDIDAPSSVVTLPGVQPTGNFFGHGDSTSIGYVYGSEGFGAWTWNGSNVSQKISAQLDNSFFEVEIAQTMGVINNYGFFVKRWGDYILFSNNYLYSTITNSWWRLFDPTIAQLYHYVNSIEQNTMWASPLQVTDASPNSLYEFTNTVGAPKYTWCSTELMSHISKTNDRVMDVRKIEVKTSCITATGSIQVEILSSNGNVWTSAITPVSQSLSNQPSVLRFNVGDDDAKGLDNFRVSIISSNSVNTPGESASAPMVWSIDVAMRTRAKIATASGN